MRPVAMSEHVAIFLLIKLRRLLKSKPHLSNKETNISYKCVYTTFGTWIRHFHNTSHYCLCLQYFWACQALHEKEPYMIAFYSPLIVQKWFNFHQTNTQIQNKQHLLTVDAIVKKVAMSIEPCRDFENTINFYHVRRQYVKICHILHAMIFSKCVGIRPALWYQYKELNIYILNNII